MSHIQYPFGAPSAEKLAHQVTIALGRNRQDMKFQNTSASLGQLIEMLSTFQTGPKDGLCMLQGELIAGQRIAKNVIRNYLMILDVDTGASVQEIGGKLVEAGLFAMIWTTHSFGKTTTEIPEEQFLRWAKKNGKAVAQDEDTLLTQLCVYLSDEKRFHPTITTTASYKGRSLVEGGMKYIIEHAPMPKLRVMFVLKEPFDFTKGASQRVRIDEWKEVYRKVSSWLDIAVDSSCVDPSRLQYTPRTPEDAPIGEDAHEILLFDGEFLDLHAVPVGTLDWTRNFDISDADEEKPRHTFVTKGLSSFLKNNPRFDVIACFEAINPDGQRGNSRDPDKVEWQCPNEEAHTVQSANDRACYLTYNGEHWHIGCLHDSCETASGGDRAFFLDKFCQNMGIADAKELEAWSPDAQKAQHEASEASNAAGLTDKIEELIDSLNKDSKVGEINDVLKVLAMVGDEITREAMLSVVQKNTGKKIPLGVMRKQLELLGKDQRKALGITSDQDQTDPRPVEPEDPDKATAVYEHWAYRKRIHVAESLIRRQNQKDPVLFLTEDAQPMTIVDTEKGVKLIDVDQDVLAAHIIDFMDYKVVDKLTGEVRHERVPQALIRDLSKRRVKTWPVVHRLAHTPIVDDAGNQVETKGYIPEMKIYLDPTVEYIPLPDEVTPEIVGEAIDIILEPIRDFPFADYGSDSMKPITLKETDSDGHPYPNLDRGVSSRAHAFCFIIQPLARHFIDGACPAYVIDKPTPGTGAGYFVDVAYIIATGGRAVAQTMSHQDEEFRKAITAALRDGSPIVFIDNINRKITSGDLASALTSGTWQDRILGQSNVTKIPIKNTWVLAGNNMDFTPEILRRLIPIRLDSNTQRPAFDRPASMFKHNPLQDYVLENRASLVWAVNVLIKNWVDKGKPLYTERTFNSFDKWARIMGGVLMAADIPGFLENIDDFNDIRNVDDDSMNEFGLLLFERFKFDHFSKTEAYQAVMGNGFGSQIELPIQLDDRNEAKSIRDLRSWMLKNMDGVPTYTEDGSGKVKLISHRTNKDRTGWKFIPFDGEENNTVEEDLPERELEGPPEDVE